MRRAVWSRPALRPPAPSAQRLPAVCPAQACAGRAAGGDEVDNRRARSVPRHTLANVAGRISEADRERVRDASRIEQVVGEYVALRNAGGGNMKGLCPFHDEKTPSFQVSPSRGYYHCFGCGEGGDVFAFLSKIESLTFVETVQRLAERANITLTITEGGSSTQRDRGSKPRLLAANKAAAEFYAAQLLTDEAAAGPGFSGRTRVSTWPQPRISAAGTPRMAGTNWSKR